MICSDITSYLAGFLLVGYSLLHVVLGFLHIVGWLVDVVFDPVDHFTLQEAQKWQISVLESRNNPAHFPQRLVDLSFHLHGKVLEHVVEVFDAPLQLQDLIVPRLDLVKSLSRRFSISQDLNTTQQICNSYYSYIFLVNYTDKKEHSMDHNLSLQQAVKVMSNQTLL